MPRKPKTTLYCMFCYTSEDDVQIMIKRERRNVAICGECVEICVKMIEDDRKKAQEQAEKAANTEK